MLHVDQVIFLAMDKEGGTLHILDVVDVAKLILDCKLGQASNFFTH
jgi:hypothetical protein